MLKQPATKRFLPHELAQLDLLRSDWGPSSLYDARGSEFLKFDETWRKIIEYKATVWEPNLSTETATPYLSAIPMLDKQMMTHWINRTTKFESKLKQEDTLARKAVREVAGPRSENYKYQDEVKNLIAIVDVAVRTQKQFRTRSLLDDLNQLVAALDGSDVWLAAHNSERTHMVAGKLVGFTLTGKGDDTAIEPIVENESGVHGLFASDYAVVPTSYLKDDGLFKSLAD